MAATTAVVNPRRRKTTKKNAKKRRKYRKGSIAAPRRRRRNPTSPYAVSNPRRRRRRNPTSAYAVSNRRRGRKRNPSEDMFDLDELTELAPASLLGNWAARAAMKLAGPVPADGPGIKHGIALILGAKLGGNMIGSLLDDPHKATVAKISAIGFGADLFVRKRLMADSMQPGHFLYDHLYLEGYEGSDQLGADTYTDPTGNVYVRTATGWALQGYEAPLGEVAPADAVPGDIYADENGRRFVVADNRQMVPLEGFEPADQLGYEAEVGDDDLDDVGWDFAGGSMYG